MLTQPILQIDLNNLIENYKTLTSIITPAFPSAVLKDDAYGLGAVKVAKALYNVCNCRHFWVAHAMEGVKIAEILPEAKIFVLQGIGNDSLALFQKYHLIPVISSPQMLTYWKNNLIEGVKPLIQVETGLNRLGFRSEELKHMSKEDLKMFDMVISHLSCADAKEHFMNEYQLKNFSRICDTYFPDLPKSIAASDGAFLGKDFCTDMVRLGAAMYGINTAPYRSNQMKPVITVKAPILQIADLAKGEFVGYSATYRAASSRKIAIISIGYGDGIPRSLSNVGKVFFKNNNKTYEARILGRISMDNIICDVTDIPNLKIGELGLFVFDEYTLDDIARDAGTISYEIVSRLGKGMRFIREYIQK